MKKEQKFEARLEELGLMEEWNKQGRCGRVATTNEKGEIILFVHEDDHDAYSEFHYPKFSELRTEYSFIKACILEWNGYDKDFEAQLDAWLSDPCGCKPCPLYPVDVYFPADGLETFCMDFEDDPEGIMNTTNCHNEALVEQINEKWNKFRDKFRPILCALYERDAEEILNSEAFSFDPAADAEWVEGYMKHNWKVEAENYLMHIADDQDLETILTFVRYDVCEGTGRDRITR